jgi:hypothetical protein
MAGEEHNDIATRVRLLEETRPTREKGDEYWAHKSTQIIVYGMVGLILTGFIAAIIVIVMGVGK